MHFRGLLLCHIRKVRWFCVPIFAATDEIDWDADQILAAERPKAGAAGDAGAHVVAPRDPAITRPSSCLKVFC